MTTTRFPSEVIILSDAIGERGGAAKATLLLAEILAEDGVRVVVYTTSRPAGATGDRLEKKGIRHVSPIVSRGAKYGWPSLSIACQAWIDARRKKTATVHITGLTKETTWFLRLPGRFRTFVWETTEALPHTRFVDSRTPRLLAKIRALLVPSTTICRNARATYDYRGQTAILPFWVDDEARETASNCAIMPRRFLFVGRMDPDKGLKFLIPAFAALRGKAEAYLDVCGSGDPNIIVELVKRPTGVVAEGNVSSSRLMQKYSECFAVVLPSLQEGYPLSLLEACCFSKPIIATAVGSIPELFGGRECAILIPPADEAALTSAMIQLLSESGEQYVRRCSDAREVFEQVSSRQAVLAALSEAYSQ